MHLGLSLHTVSGFFSEFCSQLSPGAWLQASSVLVAAVLAIVGARIAAAAAYRRANKLHWEEAEFHRLREEAAERDRINGVLHALRQELIQVRFIFGGEIAKVIEDVKPAREVLH